jgi:hypothetical protein
MSLDVLRSLTVSTLSSSTGPGLARTARLFVPSYTSRVAIRINARPPARSNARRELARLIAPRRRAS